MYKPSYIYNWKKKKPNQNHESNYYQQAWFCVLKIWLIMMSHKVNGCWAIKWKNGTHEEEVAKATAVNRHTKELMKSFTISV